MGGGNRKGDWGGEEGERGVMEEGGGREGRRGEREKREWGRRISFLLHYMRMCVAT